MGLKETATVEKAGFKYTCRDCKKDFGSQYVCGIYNREKDITEYWLCWVCLDKLRRDKI